MSNNTASDPKIISLHAIAQINLVEDFDPNVLAIEYTDEKTNEKRLRLPVMAQLAWFRLKYPTGKVIVRAQPAGKVFVGEAKVYMNVTDPDECCLASATASRGYLSEKPTISPREWAQTAALGIALRNAGFGLQFHAAGDSFDHNAINELEADMPFGIQPGDITEEEPLASSTPAEPKAPSGDSLPVAGTPASAPAPAAPVPAEPPAPEQPAETPYEQALKVPCPILKYKDKTLGDVLMLDQNAIFYISKSGGKYPTETVEAAMVICEYAAQASA